MITFHGSHNFGSVFQAFALKKRVEFMGFDCDIINFRPTAQIDKYSLVPKAYGIKTALKKIARFSQFGELKASHEKYEAFIASYLTNEMPFNELEGFSHVRDYDIYLTGSDQVWGYSIPEFMESEQDIRPAYYLSFADGKKVSYASSTGEATVEQLKPYANLLDSYSYISVRERKSSSIITELTGRKVSCNLDPTFLLSKEEYYKLLGQADVKSWLGDYILVYSLQGYRIHREWMRFVNAACMHLGMPAISISPFCPKESSVVLPIHDAGPLDILGLFANASYVLTDTFHGTLFSTHFGKQFVTFEPGRDDPRIQDVLERLELTDRIAHQASEGFALFNTEIDYGRIGVLREAEVKDSISYLNMALGVGQ